MVAQLVAEGRLSYDATVADLLPGVRLGRDDVADRVTVRHLLTHSSGLDGDIFDDTGRGDDCRRAVRRAAGRRRARLRAGRRLLLLQQRLRRARPDHRGARRRTWDDVPAERPARRAARAHRHRHPARGGDPAVGGRRPQVTRPTWSPTTPGCSRGLSARPADHRDGRRPAHLRADAPRPRYDGRRRPPARRGCGDRDVGAAAADPRPARVRRHRARLAGRLLGRATSAGHDGGTIGQIAKLRVLPDRGFAVCLLTNSANGDALAEALLPEVIAEQAGVKVPPAPGSGSRDPRQRARAARRALLAARHRLRCEAVGGELRITIRPTSASAGSTRSRPSPWFRSTPPATASRGAPVPTRRGGGSPSARCPTDGRSSSRPVASPRACDGSLARETVLGGSRRVREDRRMRILVVSDLHYRLPHFDWLVEASPAGRRGGDRGRPRRRRQPGPPRRADRRHRQYLKRLAERTTVLVASGNHDLDGPGWHGEQVATWLRRIQQSGLHVDGVGRRRRHPFTVCPWWDGPVTRDEVGVQLAGAAGTAGALGVDLPRTTRRHTPVPRRPAYLPRPRAGGVDRPAPARPGVLRPHPPVALGHRRLVARAARRHLGLQRRQADRPGASPHHPRHRGRHGRLVRGDRAGAASSWPERSGSLSRCGPPSGSRAEPVRGLGPWWWTSWSRIASTMPRWPAASANCRLTSTRYCVRPSSRDAVVRSTARAAPGCSVRNATRVVDAAYDDLRPTARTVAVAGGRAPPTSRRRPHPACPPGRTPRRRAR